MTGKALATIALIGASGLALSGCVEYGAYGAGYYGTYDPYYDAYDYRGGYYAVGPIYADPGYYVRYGDYRRPYRHYRHHDRRGGHYRHH